MTLQDILYKVPITSVYGTTAINIEMVSIDSRNIVGNGLFVAIKGEKQDGHAHIDMAINKGATAIICEKVPAYIDNAVTYIVVSNAHLSAGIIAHNFYQSPSNKLKLVGVTGTNGKTTIATLLFKLFTQLGYHCGLISTVQNQIGQTVIPATHTTPDAVSLNQLLANMVDSGCTYVFMECSSHAIHQHRIAGLHFTGAIFSNITHDHLDYHKTFDAYIQAKKMFFDNLSSQSFALTNIDDKRGLVMFQNTVAKKYTYSLKTLADFKAKILDNALMGLHLSINDTEVHCRLIGEFNAYNLLAVYGAAICLQQSKTEVLTALSMITGAEGRFDYLVDKNNTVGIVDYAHTPDALENVLATIKKLQKGYEQIITVVGCGGDRDKTKRPIMAQMACDMSTKVIFTSDNPRTEDPQAILADMTGKLPAASSKKYKVIADRKEAIAAAVAMAGPEDIILIAGKGHEKYQDINGVKHPFDDKAILQECFNHKNNHQN